MIEKILSLHTNYSIIKEIDETDLPRIIEIRTSSARNVLNKISTNLCDQKNYYDQYKVRNLDGDEVYYKISEPRNPSKIVGLVRLTKLKVGDNFSWESYIIEQGVNPIISYDVMLTLFSIGFEKFSKKLCGPWNVPAQAKNILKFHQNAGMANIIGEDGGYIQMHVTLDNYLKRIDFFRNRGIGKLL